MPMLPSLYRIALQPNVSVFNHWDTETLSWDISFRRLLKDPQILEFGQLLQTVAEKKVEACDNSCIWGLDSSGSIQLNFR